MQSVHTMSHPMIVILLTALSMMLNMVDIDRIDKSIIEPALHIAQLMAALAAILLAYKTLKTKEKE